MNMRWVEGAAPNQYAERELGEEQHSALALRSARSTLGVPVGAVFRPNSYSIPATH